MRLRYVEIFYAVMQAGSVQGAAQHLHITQPAATRLLQQAEQHLGFALFRRARGRLIPTAEAQTLYPEVEQMFQQLALIKRMVSTFGRDPAPPLRVLCVPGLALDWVPKALAQWSQRHPKLQVTLHTLHSRQIAESLALREADVGFAFQAPSHPALLTDIITTGHAVCVGPDIPGAVVRMVDLSDQEVVNLDPSDPIGRMLHTAMNLSSTQPPSRVLTHSYHAAIDLAAAGFGWAIVDSFTAAYAARHATLSVAPLEPRIDIPIHAIRSKDVPSTAAADRLVEAMRDVLHRPSSG
jgi:DNA-binding transcriptional LysR family regulator